MERSKRNVCRPQLTKTVNNINTLLDQEPALEDIYTAIAKLKLASDKLIEADKGMEPLLEENLEEELLKIAEYEEVAVTLMSRLDFRKEGLQQTVANVNNDTQPHPGPIAVANLPFNNVKLQRLELLKFNGSPKGWIPFWEQFRSAVHENVQLSNGDKFNYLRMALTGKAAEAIEGFPPSGDFYEAAFNILKEQFGNSDRLIEQYFENFTKLEQMRSRNDTITLRKNYNTVTCSMRSLTVLKVPSTQYNVLLKTSLIKSLPTDLRLGFYRLEQSEGMASNASSPNGYLENTSGVTDTDRQVVNLLKFIKNELQAMEQAFTNDKHQKERIDTEKQTRYKGTATSLFTTEAKPKNSCFFCQRDHNAALCDANLTLERKKQLLKDSSRCFRCTRPNHNSRRCFNKFITCKRCKGRHATTLCDPQWVNRTKAEVPSKILQPPATEVTALPSSTTAPSVASLMANSCKHVLLQTACVFAGSEPSEMKLIRLVIDGGSQLTFVKENVSKMLGLRIVGQQRISISAFGSKGPAPSRLCNRVQIKLKGQYNNAIVVMEAIEVPEICMDVLKVPSENTLELMNLQLADRIPNDIVLTEGISVLIGADNYWAVVTGVNKRLNDRLVAIETKFGYALHGPMPVESVCVSENLQTVLYASTISEEPEVERLWELEAVGINNETDESSSFFEDFARTSINKCDRRYEVSLPWKSEDAIVEDSNYIGARVRTEKLKYKLTNSGKLNEYNDAINELINNNYAEVVSDSEVNLSEYVYYMPHRGVFRNDKDTTKLRVVFDASAHSPNAKSLNDLLEKGPNLNPDLISVLLNFRVGTIGITADIEKAFLQVLLNDRDKDVHRFLWYDEDKLQTYRMTRVTFGVTCSPFLLSAVIRTHLRNSNSKDNKVMEVLQRGFYVDDLVISVNDDSFAAQLKQSAIKLFSEASMNLRKWTMSRHGLKENVDPNGKVSPKVLGINWHTANDRLNVDLSSVIDFANSAKIVTKRNVLQTIARVYDPIGLISPFTVKIKILFQNIWKKELGWDDIIQSDISKQWHEWTAQLKSLSNFSVPRCLFSGEVRECDLHLFADASLQAYGVVAYVRSINQAGKVDITLLCSKNRVAPLKNHADKVMTLPRLELTAALLAARLQKFIRMKLSITIKETVLWSDSQITLHWIKGDPAKWKPYVSNRVKEIQSLSRDARGWYHCPGGENPADLLTSGISAKTLIESNIWQNGPLWLRKSEVNWPQHSTNEEDTLLLTMSTVSLLNQVHIRSTRGPLTEVTKFSNLDHLLRVIAYVLRFVKNIKLKANRIIGNITPEEMEHAEFVLLTECQHSEYSDDITCLQAGHPVDLNSKILTLNPFLDDKGLLRVGGRLQNLDAEYEVIHPIILPNRAHFNKLLIFKIHNRLHHGGVNSTLYEIRKRFWMIRGRQLVKSVLSKCIICKKLRGKPGAAPFAPLPRDRVTTQTRAFAVTGLDFAGPLYFKESESKKCYIFLFTCAVTRALHLELVPNMSAETSLLAIRRFIARRGIPVTIYSDNAKTFKRLSKDLSVVSEILQGQEINNFAANHRIRWKYIVERAAWWGGFWERLVKSVKDALRASVGRFSLDREQLTTLLTEIEATINARPLTYIGNDPKDLLPLTPAHFLSGASFGNIAPSGNVTGSMLRKQWKQRMRAIEHFRKRWSTEYLQHLRSAHHNVSVREVRVTVGDVVLVRGNDNRRLLWKMGIVEDLLTGRDGKVRACSVRCANGTIFKRPIQLLYPLEVGDQ